MIARMPGVRIPAAPGRMTPLAVACSPHDRSYDPGIARAPAEISAETPLDLRFGRMRVLIQQGFGAHQHSGRAEAALDTALLEKRRLERVELTAFGQALDGLNRPTSRLEREERAGVHGPAIDQHHASSALGVVTALFGAGQAELASEDGEERAMRLDVLLVSDPVHFQCEPVSQFALDLPARSSALASARRTITGTIARR
jgi:hypothetical protein